MLRSHLILKSKQLIPFCKNPGKNLRIAQVNHEESDTDIKLLEALVARLVNSLLLLTVN